MGKGSDGKGDGRREEREGRRTGRGGREENEGVHRTHFAFRTLAALLNPTIFLYRTTKDDNTLRYHINQQDIKLAVKRPPVRLSTVADYRQVLHTILASDNITVSSHVSAGSVVRVRV